MTRDGAMVNRPPAHRQGEITQCESMGLMARGEVYQCLTDVVRRFSCHLTHMDKCINHYRFYFVSENSSPILITR